MGILWLIIGLIIGAALMWVLMKQKVQTLDNELEEVRGQHADLYRKHEFTLAKYAALESAASEKMVDVNWEAVDKQVAEAKQKINDVYQQANKAINETIETIKKKWETKGRND